MIELFRLVFSISAHVRRLVVAEVVEDALGELEGAVGEFHGGVLVKKTIVQTAEGFIPLTYLPLLPIELHFDDIVSVGAMIMFILNHARVGYRDL